MSISSLRERTVYFDYLRPKREHGLKDSTVRYLRTIKSVFPRWLQRTYVEEESFEVRKGVYQGRRTQRVGRSGKKWTGTTRYWGQLESLEWGMVIRGWKHVESDDCGFRQWNGVTYPRNYVQSYRRSPPVLIDEVPENSTRLLRKSGYGIKRYGIMCRLHITPEDPTSIRYTVPHL